MGQSPRLMKKRIFFVASNAALATAIVFGVFLEISWAGWIVAGFIWSMLFLYVVVLVDPDTRAKAQKKGNPQPAWASWSIDVVFFAGLFAPNWYLTAAAYVASCIVLNSIYNPRIRALYGS